MWMWIHIYSIRLWKKLRFWRHWKEDTDRVLKTIGEICEVPVSLLVFSKNMKYHLRRLGGKQIIHPFYLNFAFLSCEVWRWNGESAKMLWHSAKIRRRKCVVDTIFVCEGAIVISPFVTLHCCLRCARSSHFTVTSSHFCFFIFPPFNLASLP